MNTNEMATIEVQHTYHINESRDNQSDVIMVRSAMYHRPSANSSHKVWCHEEMGGFDIVVITKETAEKILPPCDKGCWTMEHEEIPMHEYHAIAPSIRISLKMPESDYQAADDLIEKCSEQLEIALEKAIEGLTNLVKEIDPRFYATLRI